MGNKPRKNILLICTAGITTGLLVVNIQKAAEEQNLDIHVFSAPAIVAEKIVKSESIDVLMIGPQSKHELKRLEDILNYHSIPFKLISKKDYQILDGEAVLEDALSILGQDM